MIGRTAMTSPNGPTRYFFVCVVSAALAISACSSQDDGPSSAGSAEAVPSGQVDLSAGSGDAQSAGNDGEGHTHDGGSHTHDDEEHDHRSEAVIESASQQSVAEAKVLRQATYSAMWEAYEEPYDIMTDETIDIVGFGSIVAVVEGRHTPADAMPAHAATTFTIRVDELLKGSAESGLVYVEVFHSPLLEPRELAIRIPAGERVFFAGSNSEDWKPQAGLENESAGRPEGSSDPLYVATSEGLVFLTNLPVSFVGDDLAQLGSPWAKLGSLEPAAAESFLREALSAPLPYQVLGECADTSFLGDRGLSGVSEEVNEEVMRLISSDECITQAEVDALWEKYPELSDAQLAG